MLNIRKFLNALGIVPTASTAIDSKGEMEVLSTGGKLNYHNGSSASPMVTEAHAATLTNKTIDADSNTISNIDNNEIKAAAAIDATKIANGSVSSTEFQFLDGVTSNIQTQLNGTVSNTLTNTHIYVGNGSNVATDVAVSGDVTITNTGNVQIASGAIVNADVNASAAIANTKLAANTANRAAVTDGSGFLTAAAATTTTEIGYVAGVTSAIQTQLNNKQPLDADLTALADLTTTGLIVRTGSSLATTRSIVGTTDQIAVTFGDGVLFNPVVSLADNPILPGTGSVTVPGGTTAQRPGSPTEGMIRRNADTNQLEGYFAGAWGPIAGSGGSVNYIATGDGNSTTGWATYADAAGASPVDATGGSPTVTWTTTTSSPLRGTSSFLFTKDAANRQGQGVSYLFSIASADQAAPSTVNFAYQVASGTYADGDLTIYIVDTTTGEVKQPTPYKVLNSANPVHSQPVEFQLNTGASYRLAIHVASTSASAYTVKFDDISLSPTAYSTGASMTSPVSYTPTFTNFGTVTNINFVSWRAGAFLKFRGTFTVGTLVAAEARISYGFGGVNGNVSTVSTLPTLSVAGYGGGSVNNQPMIPLIEASKTYMALGVETSTNNLLTKRDGNTWNNGETYSIFGEVPIQGWETSQVLSSETDTREVSLIVTGVPQSSYTANTAIIWPTVQKDTHGSYNASTGEYTVPISGTYEISAFVRPSAGGTANRTVEAYIAGSIASAPKIAFNTSSTVAVWGVTKVTAIAGQIITVRSDDAWTANVGTTQGLTITRISGPAQIASSESVNARYYASATSISGSLTTVNWTTKDFDSHNSMSSGTYTVPTSGKYQCNAGLLVAGTIALNTTCIMELQKNGTVVSRNTEYAGGAMTNQKGWIDDIISCIAGDTLRIQISSSATLPTIVSSNFDNYFSLARVGN